VFEIHAQEDDGFDTQLCGGGRYDRLMRAVGSARDVNACGFAFGVERLLSLVAESDLPALDITQALVIPVSEMEMLYALRVAHKARAQGIRTEVDISGHGVGAGLKVAAKKQIRLALIVGGDEQHKEMVTVRDLSTGEERILSIDALMQRAEGEKQYL
jgi:histidyl-tRNA synthetase